MSAGWATGAFVSPSGLWRRSCDVMRVGGGLMRGAGSSAMYRILSWSWAIGPDAERREVLAGDGEAMTPCLGAPCGANCVECAAGSQ